MQKTILVVDDDEGIRNLISMVLTGEEYKVITANDGKEGFELYQKQHPDALITDGTMPVMDGYELARKIKEINPDYPIVMYSTDFERAGDLQKAEDAGVDLCIPKSQKAFTFPEIIDRLLAEKASH